MTILCIE